MTSGYRRFMGIGLLLILAGFVFSLLFGWYSGYQPRLAAHEAYQPVFETIVEGGGNGAWQPLEEEISGNSVKHRRAADVHGHAINMGILLILVGLFAPLITQADDKSHRLLAALAAAAVVYPAGLFLQFLGLGLAGEAVSAIGAALAIAALALLYFRISKAVDTLAS